MHIESVKRWQWIAIGLVVGAALGWARGFRASDVVAYGAGINDQRLFERRVLSKVGKTACFKDILVSRQTMDEGSGKSETLYIVSGKSVPEDAKAGDQYKPMWYAAHVPYVPAHDVAQLGNGKGGDVLARWQKISQPTVLDWLELAHEGAGVSYTYAWWDSYPLRSFTLAGLIVIGVIWPFFVNLYYFKSLFRPAEEKGISLRDVHAPPAAPARDNAMSEADLEHLHELENELEASLRGGATTTGEKSADAEPAVRNLTGDTTPVASDDAHDDRHFKAKPDDYYPTEERVHPPH